MQTECASPATPPSPADRAPPAALALKARAALPTTAALQKGAERVGAIRPQAVDPRQEAVLRAPVAAAAAAERQMLAPPKPAAAAARCSSPSGSRTPRPSRPTAAEPQ